LLNNGARLSVSCIFFLDLSSGLLCLGQRLFLRLRVENLLVLGVSVSIVVIFRNCYWFLSLGLERKRHAAFPSSFLSTLIMTRVLFVHETSPFNGRSLFRLPRLDMARLVIHSEALAPRTYNPVHCVDTLMDCVCTLVHCVCTLWFMYAFYGRPYLHLFT
jgi:hypothetical protein